VPPASGTTALSPLNTFDTGTAALPVKNQSRHARALALRFSWRPWSRYELPQGLRCGTDEERHVTGSAAAAPNIVFHTMPRGSPAR
jgi:hypothetical protein